MQQQGYFTFGILTDIPPVIDLRMTLPRGDEVSEVAGLLSDARTHTVLLTGGAGAGKSTLAGLVFDQFQSHALEGLPEFRHYIWLRPGPRATWPDIIRALLNALQGGGQSEHANLSQQVNIQQLYNLLRRPGQGALIVLDQCEELFDRAIEARNQDSPYTVGAGLSGAVRFLEILQENPGASRFLLTCTKSPFGSDYSNTPGVREYMVGNSTIVEALNLLQQRSVLGLQQDLSTLWQRCSGHMYTLIVFSALKSLSGLSLHYLLNSPMYQILWEGNVLQNLLEATLGFLNPIPLSLVRALCLFREAPPLAGIIHVAIGGRPRLETDLQAFELEARNLTILGLIEQIKRPDGQDGYLLHPLFARYLQSHYLESEHKRSTGYLPSSLGVTDQPGDLQVTLEARQSALAAGHTHVADYYWRVARQICPPRHQRGGPNDVTSLLAMLEHLCLGWHWQTAYDQLCALSLDEDLLRWESWHSLIRLYEMMLPPTGSLIRRDEGLVCSALAMVYSRLGEFEQSRAYFTSALAIQRDMQDYQSEAITLINLGEFLRTLGDLEQARQNFEQALTLVTPQSNPELACVLAHNMALLTQHQHNYQQSLYYFLQSLQLARQIQDWEREGLILTNLGLFLCEQQRYQDGLALLLPALQKRYARNDPKTVSLIAFLNKLEQRMGNAAFADLRQAAQLEGQQERVLRTLAL
ncbi:MAG TPA: tetratricopeptide repeat protein [Ktedonobacteraceae bacterium]